MNRRELGKLERELREYLDGMVEGMGRIERKAAMRNYVVGLLLDGERKSVEPMAARLVDAPEQIGAMRQRLLDCVGQADWRESEMLRRLACKLERELPGVEALVVDDTGFPKKGELSVGVARQYSGTLGRTDNCQVATSLHLAGEQGSGCIGLTVYLPESWTSDGRRCRAAGVPKEIGFRRKWEIVGQGPQRREPMMEGPRSGRASPRGARALGHFLGNPGVEGERRDTGHQTEEDSDFALHRIA